ncbi:hypothetical protein KCU83_g627, partial [Aureobasidium melanogenum]
MLRLGLTTFSPPSLRVEGLQKVQKRDHISMYGIVRIQHLLTHQIHCVFVEVNLIGTEMYMQCYQSKVRLVFRALIIQFILTKHRIISVTLPVASQALFFFGTPDCRWS